MFRIHPTIGAMLIIVRMKVVQQGEADFLIENVSDLEQHSYLTFVRTIIPIIFVICSLVFLVDSSVIFYELPLFY